MKKWKSKESKVFGKKTVSYSLRARKKPLSSLAHSPSLWLSRNHQGEQATQREGKRMCQNSHMDMQTKGSSIWFSTLFIYFFFLRCFLSMVWDIILSIRQIEENTHARTQRQRLFRLSLVFSTEEISVRMNGGRENGEEGSQSLNLISSSLKKKKSFEWELKILKFILQESNRFCFILLEIGIFNFTEWQ